jgi:formate dehydrogenase major subunit
MFKNIKVENGAVSTEDILREINRGGASAGYCRDPWRAAKRT